MTKIDNGNTMAYFVILYLPKGHNIRGGRHYIVTVAGVCAFSSRPGHFFLVLFITPFTSRELQSTPVGLRAFLARDVIYTSRAYATMSVSVCLSGSALAHYKLI